MPDFYGVVVQHGRRWACDHARFTQFSKYTFAELCQRVGAGAVSVASANEELMERGQKCPACRRQDRRNRNHWAALFVMGALLLLTAWRCW